MSEIESLMISPETKYVKSENGDIAYQIFGSGEQDILFLPNWSSNLEAMWEEPSLVRYLTILSSIGRVIYFDKRGTGISDPVPIGNLPTLEQWMDDASDVLSEIGCDEVAVIGDTEGGVMAMLFAATYPQKVTSLILINTTACWKRDDDYPIGMPDDTIERVSQYVSKHWGTSKLLELSAPSMTNNKRFGKWFAKYQRMSSTPSAMLHLYRWGLSLDVRSVLPSINVPTLILHRTENAHYRIQYGKYLSDNIPKAKFIPIKGADCWPFNSGNFELILNEIQIFLTGEKTVAIENRVLATIMFTDIVDSTKHALKLGDKDWSELLTQHNNIIQKTVLKYRGETINSTGDGFLSTFDGPARSLQCAREIIQELRTLGIEVRVGLHTGEIELVNGEANGIAIHITARIMALATAGEVATSRTIKDLVIGSGFQFIDNGLHSLKGVPDQWHIYKLAMENH
jgi:class 3 adenylate cyclase/pimeloyl-ACP methyl ester carboxylesterase